jgi:signal transduction histidine kinase
VKKRLIAVYLLLILIPLGLISWLGWRNVKDERERNRLRLEAVLLARLRDVDERIQSLLREQEAAFLQMADIYTMPIDEIRRIARKSRMVRQFFKVDPEGELLYPAPDDTLSSKEQEFLLRTNGLDLSASLFQRPKETASRQTSAAGWYTWFWAEGINFIFWQTVESGGILGIEVERVALIADIVAFLPDSEITPDQSEAIGRTAGARQTPQGRIVLQDVKGEIIYQWGAFRPEADDAPVASIPLSPPLSTWRLGYFADKGQDSVSLFGSGLFSLASGLFVLLLALGGLAVYFYRESSREIREALQRVSFVNQVSHELKTPLTNIRMYAELLEGEIEAGQEKAQGFLGIVVSESRRLSRLIQNVLTFAGKEKKGLNLHRTPGSIDDAIAAIIENFRPAFESKGVDIKFLPVGKGMVNFDADILEQIVNNLVSNVEKYATGGKYLEIQTRQEGDKIFVRVSDRGPGIPSRERKRIFLPFTRISNRLTDGITGTGIGLAISRDLAVLHGGSLELLPSERGAVFLLTLHAPPAVEARDEAELGEREEK